MLEALLNDGRVAIVTGASRWLGRVTAVALAEAGADVGEAGALRYHPGGSMT
jgi:NAD(P)-dependent dehydrogenase (short-subunit alcohol dehydrogenase family)